MDQSGGDGREENARRPSSLRAPSGTATISRESLSNIHQQKSLIAEMRPARRKIKWNRVVSDWDRRNDNTTRIRVGIGLDDLQIHGGVPVQQQQEEPIAAVVEDHDSSMTDFSFAEGDRVDVLELKLTRTYRTIKRLAKESDGLDEQAAVMREENQTLRQEVADIPMGIKTVRRGGLEQLLQMEKKLQRKLKDMERQNRNLKRRTAELERAKQRIRVDVTPDDAKSHHTHASRIVVSNCDDSDQDDEEIEVFSTGRSISASESESSLELDQLLESSLEEEGDEANGADEEDEYYEDPLTTSKSNLGESLMKLSFDPNDL
jgi:uncharacterized protein YeeX (DUF496 family)